jgi:hypothetical protein
LPIGKIKSQWDNDLRRDLPACLSGEGLNRPAAWANLPYALSPAGVTREAVTLTARLLTTALLLAFVMTCGSQLCEHVLIKLMALYRKLPTARKGADQSLEEFERAFKKLFLPSGRNSS